MRSLKHPSPFKTFLSCFECFPAKTNNVPNEHIKLQINNNLTSTHQDYKKSFLPSCSKIWSFNSSLSHIKSESYFRDQLRSLNWFSCAAVSFECCSTTSLSLCLDGFNGASRTRNGGLWESFVYAAKITEVIMVCLHHKESLVWSCLIICFPTSPVVADIYELAWNSS